MMTRMELHLARRMVHLLMADDHKGNGADAEPWAYSKVLDHIERRLTGLPDLPAKLRPGDPAEVTWGVAGRYLAAGDALWIDPENHQPAIMEVSLTGGFPPPGLLPTDEVVAGAAAAYSHLLPGVS